MHIRMMIISMNLKKGEVYRFREDDIREATLNNFKSRLFTTVTQNDIKAFCEKMSENWGVRMVHIPETRQWDMIKE